MKKIAIVLDEMSIGGIPKACVSFVKQLIEFFDVTMIMRRDDGELVPSLPKEVSVRLMRRPGFRDVIKKLLAERRYVRLFRCAIPYFFWSHVFHRWVKANEMVAKEAGCLLEGEYDCVIAYHGMNISHLIAALHNVKAKKTIAWIHGDHPFQGIHKTDVEKIYRKFDKIYCVSPTMRDRFLSDFPSVSERTESYKNVLEVERIKELAEAYSVDFDASLINVVTVGRVSPEKGQDLIPDVVRQLIDRGLKIKWYIVGDGGDTDRIKALCREAGVEECVVFVGAKQNPYPYMKSCDIYVQPSYTEGYCLTVCEAAILHKPIVLTKIAAAAGILTGDENSVVTESNAQAIAEGIQKMVDNPEMQERFVAKLKNMDLSNRDEIQKLISFLSI